MKRTLIRWTKRVLLAVGSLTAIYWLFCLPTTLFKAPLSAEVLSADGELLSAHIARDGQWRMPPPDSVSPKLRTAVITYEDRTFYDHWGVSVRGVVRAVRDNWEAGRVVSGGSTITMQVARLARGNQGRTLFQKIVEALWATRMEWSYDKQEILDLWLANAPFGGNVVGVESAARRYYDRSPAELSWAEAATLAVLPNSPALIHPGRARSALQVKRDQLLDQLVATGALSEAEADLAKLEELPDRPRPLPRRANHLAERLRWEQGNRRFHTTIDAGLQDQVTRLVAAHHRELAESNIHNVAALVTEVATGQAVAYVGNAAGLDSLHAPAVDMITAQRSPGSLLKPHLYGLALDEGKLLPRQLLPDVPVSFAGFQPANFHRDYAGAVPADVALARSLNIPFVYLLRDVSVARMHGSLGLYGYRLGWRPPEHYGLSLILGGAEVTMEEINGWFTGLARQVRYFADRQGRYGEEDFVGPVYEQQYALPAPLADITEFPTDLSAGAAYRTLEALTALDRPDETGRAHRFSSHRRIAWKTGTSFGFRDAWASGCTPAYAVTVWTGNADGTGRDGLVGVKAAAPLLFRIFRVLEGRSATAPAWFEPPWDDLRRVTTCETSGFLAGTDCPTREEYVPRGATRGGTCPYHQKVFTEESGQFQVRQDCYAGEVIPRSWFSLPANQAYYYRQRHANYLTRPPFRAGCTPENAAAELPMQFIYPYRNGVISAARNWRGETEPLLFTLAHQQPETAVHWHLDGEFLRTTSGIHQVATPAGKGNHELVVVDAKGARLVRRFTVR